MDSDIWVARAGWRGRSIALYVALVVAGMANMGLGAGVQQVVGTIFPMYVVHLFLIVGFWILSKRPSRQLEWTSRGLRVRRVFNPRKGFFGFGFRDVLIEWSEIQAVHVETGARARSRRSLLGRLARWVTGPGPRVVFRTRMGEAVLGTDVDASTLWAKLRSMAPAAQVERIERGSADPDTPTILA